MMDLGMVGDLEEMRVREDDGGGDEKKGLKNTLNYKIVGV